MMRTTDYPEAARIRLGRAVQAARTRAGYSRTAFAEKVGPGMAGISKRHLADLEGGRPGISDTKLRAVARHLPGWTEDTPRAILEGAAPPVAALPEFSPEIQARLDRIERSLGRDAYIEARDLLREAQKYSDRERGAS